MQTIDNFETYFSDISQYTSRFTDYFIDNSTETRLLSPDEANILSNFRRRGTLRALIEKDNGMYKLGDLAEQVAAWENQKDISEINSDERKTVYVNLYDYHLAPMDEKDFLEYNKDRGIIKANASTSEFETYLEETPSPDDTLEVEQYLEDENTENKPPKKSDAFQLISIGRRRKALQFLDREESSSLGLCELAEKMASLKNSKPIYMLNSTERDNEKLPLYQNHLTKLDDHNIVDYEQGCRTIEKDVYFEPLVDYLPELDPNLYFAGEAETENENFDPRNILGQIVDVF